MVKALWEIHGYRQDSIIQISKTTNSAGRKMINYIKIHLIPPKEIRRTVPNETLKSFLEKNEDLFFYTDEEIIEAPTYREMRKMLERVHNSAHTYIGGTIPEPHTAFRDPFVFLIHSNVDRLFAMWQYRNKEERLSSQTIYGDESEKVWPKLRKVVEKKRL